MCEHKNFKTIGNVARLIDNEENQKVVGYRVDFEVHCMDCFMPFEFVGLPGGYSPGYPTTNVEGTEARMPIKPAG